MVLVLSSAHHHRLGPIQEKVKYLTRFAPAREETKEISDSYCEGVAALIAIFQHRFPPVTASNLRKLFCLPQNPAEFGKSGKGQRNQED